MLSRRGAKSAASQDIPWRFAPGGGNRYDAVTNPTGVISFATAENNLVTEELHEFLQKNVSIPSLAFKYRFSTMGGPVFPQAVASHLNDMFHTDRPVEANSIITASGLTAIHKLLGDSIADPGDGILVTRPIYGRFELDFGNVCGLKMVYADMHGVDPFCAGAIPLYQARLDAAREQGQEIKAVLIVNPHNPMGRTYSAEALIAIMQFCQRNKLHLISDEVYGLSVYDKSSPQATPFTSVLSIPNSQDYLSDDNLHVLYGMSKDFGAAGLRLGCLITRSTQLRKAVACNMRFHNPSGMSIAIGTAILQDRDFVNRFIDLSRRRLLEARQYTSQVLDKAGVEYDKRSNAGFFLFINLQPWLREPSVPATNGNGNGIHKTVQIGENPEFALAQRMLEAGVGLHPCEEHAEGPGWFRLVFSQEQPVLEEGLRRLVTVLKEIEAS